MLLVFVSALEDTISLAARIALAGGNQAIPDSTRVHNHLLFARVSCLQGFGVLNGEKAQGKAAGEPDGDKNAAAKKHILVGRWDTQP